MTEFICKLCSALVEFNPEDPQTYIQKKETGNPLIGKLFTFRVAHKSKSHTHINVVVVDDDGSYRAHKDAYLEFDKAPESVTQWQTWKEGFPSELRPYLDLADLMTQQLILESSPPFKQSIGGWTQYLLELWDNYPQNNSIGLLAAKWCFIIGQNDAILERKPDSKAWTFPIYLRLQARIISSQALVKQASNIDLGPVPPLVQAEVRIAQADIYQRCGAYEKLEEIYLKCQTEWGEEKDLTLKETLLLAQSAYGFGLGRQGKMKKALEVLEPAFTLAQLIGNRELINTLTSTYGSALAWTGDLAKAKQVYNIKLDLCEELGDKRGKIIAVLNISDVEASQGSYEKALKQLKIILDLPVVQKDTHLRIPVLINLADVHYKLKQYAEAIAIAKRGIGEEKQMSPPMQIAAFDILLKTARDSQEADLVDWIQSHLPKDKFSYIPSGQILISDLEITRQEIAKNWQKVIDLLEEELKIINEHGMIEKAIQAEIWIARAHFNLYHNSENIQDLNQCYKRLDLARSIAIEREFNSDLCRLTQLKGLLAAKAGTVKRAEKLFLEAKEIAQKYSMTTFEKEIDENLKELYEGRLGKTDELSIQLFNSLKAITPTTGTRKGKLVKVFALWISAQSFPWELFCKAPEDEIADQIAYLLGMRDLWKIMSSSIIQRGLTSVQGQLGTTMVEISENFLILALCSQESYKLRTSLRDMIVALEDFPLSHIGEELTGMAELLVKKKFGSFLRVRLR